MQHKRDCDSVGELTIHLTGHGDCSVTVAAPFAQALATMRLATRFLESVLHPGGPDASGAPTVRAVTIVEKSSVPPAGSF